MTDNIRLFIGAEIPTGLKDFVMQQSKIYAPAHIKMVPAANLHLTVFFIGNKPASELPFILSQTEKIAAAQSDFTLNLHKIEPGPSTLKPRLVWARFHQHSEFGNLAFKLQQEIAPEIGLPKEMIPHTTLARLTKKERPPFNLPTLLPPSETSFKITRLALWQSELAMAHPKYTILKSFSFGGIS